MNKKNHLLVAVKAMRARQPVIGCNIAIVFRLANLDDAAYTAIGHRIRELVDEYHRRWKESRK